MKFISQFKDKKKKQEPDTLRFLLHKGLQTRQPARGTDVIHASELWKTGQYKVDIGLCPRECALRDILKKTRDDEVITTSQASTFQHGKMTANWIVHFFADLGRCVGNWACPTCSKKFTMQQRPQRCDCGGKRFNYEEISFRSKESGIIGSIDFLFLTRAKKLKPVELKSIMDDKFKELAGPLAEHKIRTNLYLRIIADSEGPLKDRIDTSEGIVLYASKGGWGKKDESLSKEGITDGPFTPFKEFIVQRNDAETDLKWSYAVRLKQFRDGKKDIPLGVCGNQWTPRAEQCNVRSECFSGKFPGTE
jgi:hypothetical protein